MVEKKPSS